MSSQPATGNQRPATSPTLGQLLDTVASRHSDRAALLWADGRMSFRQLADRAAALACGLAAAGTGKGTRVGILMPNRADWLAIAFAAWKLGAVVVPLNTLSRKPELEHALHHADVSVLLTAAGFLKHDYAAMLREIAEADCSKHPLSLGRLPNLRRVVFADEIDDLIDAGRSLPREWLEAAQSATSATEIAAIFFTSGTTALPKGVVHTHASMLHAADNVATCLGLDESDRTWGYLPFFFTGGLVAVALATLSRGGAVLLQEVFDAGATLKLMSEHRCTTLFAWPHQAEALIAHPAFSTTRLHLRKGVGANTKWAPRLYPADHQAVGTWGMTETGPMAAASSHDDPPEIRSGAHGRALSGLELRVIDPETGHDLEPGREGELLVRGAPLMQQYYKVARADCFDADGFFHTGDLAGIDADGLLHFVGRLKDVIKTAGVNVAAAEVEAVLQRHPAVKVAHVVGLPHPTRGENVVAVVVLQHEPRATSGERQTTTREQRVTQLTDFCREQLASYKVPRHFVFMNEDQLPVLGSGKVDKKRLREIVTASSSTRS